MKTKIKNRLIGSVVAGVGLVVPMFAGFGAYAAGPEISINNGAENLYVSSGSQSSADGAANYDASTNTLTLNNFNGSNIVISGLNDINVSLVGENTLDMNTTSNTIPEGITATDSALTVTGTGSLTVNQPNLPGFAASASIIKAGSITIDSATLNLTANSKSCLSSTTSSNVSLADGGITINSGTLTLACNTAMQSEDITINGGSLTVDGKLSSVVTISKNLTVNDGKLTINAESLGLGSAMTFYGSVKINGGETNIHGGQYGIEFTNLSGTLGSIGYFSISGGTLNIDNTDEGIHIDDANANSYMEFAGGTTTIDAKYSAAKIIYSDENDKNISIADKMFLSPSNLSVEMEHKDYSGVYEEYIYYLASNGQPATNITITDQTIAPESDSEEEIAVPDTAGNIKKAPNTGMSTGDQPHIIAIISIAPIILASIFGLIHFIRSRKSIKLDY